MKHTQSVGGTASYQAVKGQVYSVACEQVSRPATLAAFAHVLCSATFSALPMNPRRTCNQSICVGLSQPNNTKYCAQLNSRQCKRAPAVLSQELLMKIRFKLLGQNSYKLALHGVAGVAHKTQVAIYIVASGGKVLNMA